MSRNIIDVFFRKASLVYLSIEDNITISGIVSKVDIEYSYVPLLLKVFEKNNLIKKEKVGREVRIFLTDKGKEVQNLLKEVRNVLSCGA